MRTIHFVIVVLFCSSSLFAQEVMPIETGKKQAVESAIEKKARLFSQLETAYLKLSGENDGLRTTLSLTRWKLQIYEAYVLRAIYEKRDEVTVEEDRKLISAFIQQDVSVFPDIARKAVERDSKNAFAQEILAFGLYGEGISFLGKAEELWLEKRNQAREKLNAVLNLHLKNDAKIAAIMKTSEIEKKYEKKLKSGERLSEEEYLGHATKLSYERLKNIEGIPFDPELKLAINKKTPKYFTDWFKPNLRDFNKK